MADNLCGIDKFTKHPMRRIRLLRLWNRNCYCHRQEKSIWYFNLKLLIMTICSNKILHGVFRRIVYSSSKNVVASQKFKSIQIYVSIMSVRTFPRRRCTIGTTGWFSNCHSSINKDVQRIVINSFASQFLPRSHVVTNFVTFQPSITRDYSTTFVS